MEIQAVRRGRMDGLRERSSVCLFLLDVDVLGERSQLEVRAVQLVLVKHGLLQSSLGELKTQKRVTTARKRVRRAQRDVRDRHPLHASDRQLFSLSHMCCACVSVVVTFSFSNSKSKMREHFASVLGLCSDLRYGCASASSTPMRWLGLKVSIFSMRSSASGFASLYILLNGMRGFFLSDLMYSSAFSLEMNFISSADGVPSTLKIKFICLM